MAQKKFTLVHAQHAVSQDGTNVEFMHRHQLSYSTPQRSILLFIESYVADDLAPDGVVVRIDDKPTWNNGQALTSEEFNEIMADLQLAAIPLLTKFRWP